MARGNDYRLRAGTHAVVDLTTTYRLSGLAKQSDQRYNLRWSEPNFLLSSTPERPTVNVMLDFSAVTDGKYAWEWVFSIWSEEMLEYWNTTFTPSGAESGLVTCTDYLFGNNLTYFNATIYRPRGERMERVEGIYWGNVRVRFAGGAIIT